VTAISATYMTPDGVHHYVDVLDDGYYIAETPDLMLFDSSAGLDWTSPLGSDWLELWPGSDMPGVEIWWTLESWEDNGEPTGELSASDQIDMINLDTGEKWWFHVEWVNPTPVASDGKTDMIGEIKPVVPEFPLGVGLMIAIAPAIPIVYLLRTRRKVE